MKKKYIIQLFISVTFLLLSSFNFLSSQDIDSLLLKWENRLKKENLISCRIKQIKNISFLKNKVFLEGEFYYKYPHFFRMEIRGDENYDIYCDGEKVYIIDHDLGEKEIHDVEELYSRKRPNKLALPLLGQTREQIKKNYKIIFQKKGQLYEVHPLSHTSQSYEKLHFKIDNMDRIEWMKIFYKNSDWTEIEFKKWKEHGKVSDYFFKYLK